MVIPETFSSYTNPLDNKAQHMMKRITELPDTKAIFCRVDGEDPSIFQRVVAFMGSRRAWKTSGFDKSELLDLNAQDLADESSFFNTNLGRNRSC